MMPAMGGCVKNQPLENMQTKQFTHARRSKKNYMKKIKKDEK